MAMNIGFGKSPGKSINFIAAEARYTGLNVWTVFAEYMPSWWKHSSRFNWQRDYNHWSLQMEESDFGV